MSETTMRGELTLGHLLGATGLDLADVVIVRHTFTAGGLESTGDLTAETLLAYTRVQALNNKLGRKPPRHWLTLMADGGRRSRYLTAYENLGEIEADRTDAFRSFDLRPSEVLAALSDRLVVEWSRDAVNWAKTANAAASFPVIEIADPEVVRSRDSTG